LPALSFLQTHQTPKKFRARPLLIVGRGWRGVGGRERRTRRMKRRRRVVVRKWMVL
jgi:hypothetical protein